MASETHELSQKDDLKAAVGRQEDATSTPHCGIPQSGMYGVRKNKKIPLARPAVERSDRRRESFQDS